jgi:hypothetical protein
MVRIDHFQVCPGKNSYNIVLCVLRLIGEGISLNLSIPPNSACAILFRLNRPVSFGSVCL